MCVQLASKKKDLGEELVLRGMRRNCSWEQYFLRKIPWFKIHVYAFFYSKANTQYTSQTKPPKCPTSATYHFVLMGLDFFLFLFLRQGLIIYQDGLQTQAPSALPSLSWLGLYLDIFFLVAIYSDRIFLLTFPLLLC